MNLVKRSILHEHTVFDKSKKPCHIACSEANNIHVKVVPINTWCFLINYLNKIIWSFLETFWCATSFDDILPTIIMTQHLNHLSTSDIGFTTCWLVEYENETWSDFQLIFLDKKCLNKFKACAKRSLKS